MKKKTMPLEEQFQLCNEHLIHCKIPKDRQYLLGRRELLRYQMAFRECNNILDPEQKKIVSPTLTKLELV
jgi:hypothetical protein